MKEQKIVVVEDELLIRSGLVHLLRKLGYHVAAEAENGLEGLKLIRDIVPDLVITDVQMPQMDGLKMIEEVLSLGLTPKFVILSGFADFKYAQKALRLGAVEYLLKPISVQSLTEMLTRLCGEEEEEVVEETCYCDLVQQMVRTVEHNYGQRLGLDLFSEQFKMTPEHLSRLFAKETGKTFSDYLRQVRLEHAKQMLCTTNLKIYEIACRVGYPDAKYFSKIFKEYTGYSAKQYPSLAMQQK